MNSSLLPLLKFIALALLGGSITLMAATFVLGLGAPLVRADARTEGALTLTDLVELILS